MKLPEPLFAIINPLVTLLLRSPVHGFWSDSLMLITFTGRNSGRQFTTPVRYIQNGAVIRCFTSASNQWWRNLRGGAAVTLRLRGQDCQFLATAIENDPDEVRKWLHHYLGLFPQDAAYHNIRLNPDKTLLAEDLDAASRTAIVVQAAPQSGR
ncbi:MAG TPA: nitroreductase/quinone reductase family protein [Steroidobacteraceae bacterium]|nr:nitroreductase/quinone reductase family protein [Steroidobacteraceae bacterium]HRX88581.1 nitroreductase/quinone reductase family protein [Steroidobacteraceae bacterium]